ncbi:MAG: FAD-dependent oxidoreductase, partial [Synergistaceae bacterium]|nr:FAD-dependent oxidoreductase [Synergistaceae bacterium]
MENRQLVIVGAGPAGITAAIYGRRAGIDVLLLENGLSGGQINVTPEIENYPGFKHVEGMDLANAFREHAEKFGAEFRDCKVESVSFENGAKTIRTNKGDIEAGALIIASGASFSKAGCKGEKEFAGRGVSYCAVCDGAFYEDVPIAVIGGGNTAVEEADYLTQFASKVYIIHRREEFRAQKSAVDRALANPKIETVMGFVVDEISGGDTVERVAARNLKSGETRLIDVGGVFVFVGTSPNIEFLGGEKSIKRTR